MPIIKGPSKPERGGCEPRIDAEPDYIPDAVPVPMHPSEEPILVPNWPAKTPVKEPQKVENA